MPLISQTGDLHPHMHKLAFWWNMCYSEETGNGSREDIFPSTQLSHSQCRSPSMQVEHLGGGGVCVCVCVCVG